MSVSLIECIEAAGFDLTTLDDANWLLSKESEWDELVERAEELVEAEEQRLYDIAEAEYQKTFPEEDNDDNEHPNAN